MDNNIIVSIIIIGSLIAAVLVVSALVLLNRPIKHRKGYARPLGAHVKGAHRA